MADVANRYSHDVGDRVHVASVHVGSRHGQVEAGAGCG